MLLPEKKRKTKRKEKRDYFSSLQPINGMRVTIPEIRTAPEILFSSSEVPKIYFFFFSIATLHVHPSIRFLP